MPRTRHDGPVSRRSVRRPAIHRDGDSAVSRVESLAVEDPLTVTLDGDDVFTTMRTPGNDIELALGWLVSDGVISAADEVVSARECRTIFEAPAALAGGDSDLTERTAVEVALAYRATSTTPTRLDIERVRNLWHRSSRRCCLASCADHGRERRIHERGAARIVA